MGLRAGRAPDPPPLQRSLHEITQFAKNMKYARETISRGKTNRALERPFEMKHSDSDTHDQFLRLFLEHETSLKAYLRSVLFNAEESREVMQEVAVVLWRKFEPDMTSESFRRWAFGVAKMEALAFRRDRARDRHSFGDAVYELLEEAALAPAVRLDARRQALQKCLEKLPAYQVRLVRAAYAPGAQIDAVASAIGRTAMAVYKSLHRIRVGLATCIEQTMRTEDLL